MAAQIEIKVRKTWARGPEVSFDVEAFKDGLKMFSPGATVTRDHRRPFGPDRGDLVVTVGWASAANDKSLENGKTQLEVMRAAVALAELLEASAGIHARLDASTAEELIAEMTS